MTLNQTGVVSDNVPDNDVEAEWSSQWQRAWHWHWGRMEYSEITYLTLLLKQTDPDVESDWVVSDNIPNTDVEAE